MTADNRGLAKCLEFLGLKLGFHEELFTLVEKTRFANPPLSQGRKPLAASLRSNLIENNTIMKCIIIVSFLFFANIVISQEDKNLLFKNAIDLIKQSQEFKSYSKDSGLKNDNVKVAKYAFSICQDGWFFYDVIGKDIRKKCNDNWINNPLIEIRNPKKLSDKGKKSFIAYFSDVYNTYFVVEIQSLNHSNISLVSLMKIENEKVILIESKQATTEITTR